MGGKSDQRILFITFLLYFTGNEQAPVCFRAVSQVFLVCERY